MEQIAFSELNMTPEILYNMTPRNFANAQIGAAKLHNMKEHAAWERARWVAAIVINPHTKRKIMPKDITTFPWEKYQSKTNKKHDIEKMIKQAEYWEKIDLKNIKNNA